MESSRIFFQTGQYVRWGNQHEDVPAGAVGIVAAIVGERVCVSFHTGSFLLKPGELVVAKLSWADLPEEDWSWMKGESQSPEERRL